MWSGTVTSMDEAIYAILADVLGLDRSRIRLNAGTALLGQLPEFDSMAVVAILTAIEDQFGITVNDDEVDASIFETAGSLIAFVLGKAGSPA